MGRYVSNAGHEQFADGMIGFYCGIETPPGGVRGFHVSTGMGARLTRSEFVQLDNVLRSGDINAALLLINQPPYRVTWKRIEAQLHRVFPQHPALELFIEAWNRTI